MCSNQSFVFTFHVSAHRHCYVAEFFVAQAVVALPESVEVFACRLQLTVGPLRSQHVVVQMLACHVETVYHFI